MFQHSLVSLFWGHAIEAAVCGLGWIVSALSGESILGPLLRYFPFTVSVIVFQHSLVSLFWGHLTSVLVVPLLPVFQHSLVSLFWGHLLSLGLEPELYEFQHSLVSLFWGHTAQPAEGGCGAGVSALSGESILGPLLVRDTPNMKFLFQHSLVSLFWGHLLVHPGMSGGMRVSALSGESILGPPGWAVGFYPVLNVSALSGESILGPRKLTHAHKFCQALLFQHSLVSLFWGHEGL